ncbi:hypothetical protein Hbl1158_17075 (plasmid) [Halobaculum sp. CBA1158]|uniref:hypothetical protein n=1 Tax=Halobaculum sp. CBA1158 TaxID=2904243 RepID=UPI001F2B439B|nr:hypothetical protein [Halobaculum sp. CBA1158]UIP01715.1 hypothetical protein Hbl1158_17075 [Halobaculum sp. CBA1158]
MTQEAHAAVCRSYEGEAARARERIEIALETWNRDDAVREQLVAARQHYLVGEVCRQHLREAAQLLVAEGDPEADFKRGGAFA